MNKRLSYLAGLIVTLCFIGEGIAQEHEKLAQSGMQFLSVAADARAAAMAGAVITDTEMKSGALFFNPACMAGMSDFIDFSASQNKWIADITHNAFSFAIRPWHGEYGVFGVSFQSVDYGEVLKTRVDKTNPLGYVDMGDFSPSSLTIGVGYAKALTDRFSVGGQMKWVRQNLGESIISVGTDSSTAVENELTPLAFDFGTLFHTGVKSLVFGMSVRNFSKEIKYAQEGFQLPLVFTLGISMDILDLVTLGGPKQSVVLSINASHYRSHPEQIMVGIDYRFMDILSVRGGYVSGDYEDNFTFGFGVSHYGFQLDYAYTPFGIFDKVQRMTIRFSL